MATASSISAGVTMYGGNSRTTSFNFIVTLSTASEKEVSVNFATEHGTTSDSDYFARTGTLYFAPGQTSQTISIQVKGDKDKDNYAERSIAVHVAATRMNTAHKDGFGP